ncbi:alcohol dehydrogenase [Bifidobacterium aquikefiricola]|uniref:Alcohol dehydrogenase n=1 Tax=Bifidobacterium aquikefiricola TaxID=3059038 RepID=A0AB39U4I6_9BIFI
MKSSMQGLNTMMLGMHIDRAQRSLMPLTFRFSMGLRLLISLLLGFFVALVGTVAHRMGAAMNIPYGLLLALVLAGLSAWEARARSGIIGLVLHLVASCFGVGMLAGQGPMGDVLIPVGGAAFTTYFGLYVGYYWLLGLIVVQFVIALLPLHWFVVVPRLSDDAPIPTAEATSASISDVSAIEEHPSTVKDAEWDRKERHDE